MKKLLCAVLVLMLLAGCAPRVPPVDDTGESPEPSVTDNAAAPEELRQETPGETPTAENTPAPTDAAKEDAGSESGSSEDRNPSPGPADTPAPAVTAAPSAPPVQAGGEADMGFESYGDIAAAIDAINLSSNSSYGYYSGFRGGFGDFAVTNDMEMADAVAEEAPASASFGGGVKAESDWSGTNVQVAGVDEGDIVKTDGKYIYILKGTTLEIYRAAGSDTLRMSRTELEVPESNDSYLESDSGWTSEGHYCNVREMFLYENTLAVVYGTDEYSESYDENEGKYSYSNSQRTEVLYYDLSVPEAPQLISKTGQDGYYLSGRMYGGILYIVTSHGVYDWVFDDPGSFVPNIYRGGTPELIAVDRIIMLPDSDESRYLVVTSSDASGGEMISCEAVLGAGNADMYMNEDCIYLASSEWVNEELSIYTESVYTVRDYFSGYRTSLVRIGLEEDGSITAEANGKVDGRIIGQFAMDERDGYFRIVTTNEPYRYTTYTDEEYGFVNYRYPEERSPSSSGLYILDKDMEIVGSLTGLGENETVYSVRFSGDTAYFVTYRQTDPLFAVDVSDPGEPRLMSALKIPGFSEYLHPYGEGLLLGLGMGSEDPEQTWQDRVKLSMFDVSDPYDVSELSVLLLDAYYTPALNDHHAILVDSEKNLIGFATDTGYEVYRYTDSGFVRQTVIDIEGYTWDTRSLYIGDWLYIITENKMFIVYMNSWWVSREIALM